MQIPSVFLIILFFFGSAVVDDGRVEQEYLEALAEMEALYENVSGSGSLQKELELINQPNYRELQYEVQFAWNGELFEKYENNLIEGGDLLRQESVFCKNDEIAFRLNKESDTDDRFHAGYVGEDKSAISRTINVNVRTFVKSAFCITGFPISNVLKDPGFSVVGTESKLENGLERLKIRFVCDSNTIKVKKGWLVVCPDEGWTLESYRCEKTNGSILNGKIEYENTSGKFVPKLVIFERCLGSLENPKPGQRFRFEIDEISFQSTPENEFTLEYYGVPSLRKTTNTYFLWILGPFTILFAVLLVFSKIRNRAQEGKAA